MAGGYGQLYALLGYRIKFYTHTHTPLAGLSSSVQKLQKIRSVTRTMATLSDERHFMRVLNS